MTIILSTLKKILFWSYDRGSWQYDVMCVLILAFIILAPNRVFEDHSSARSEIVRAEEIGNVDRDHLQQAIEARLRQKYGSEMTVSRIEQSQDGLGEVYIVYARRSK